MLKTGEERNTRGIKLNTEKVRIRKKRHKNKYMDFFLKSCSGLWSTGILSRHSDYIYFLTKSLKTIDPMLLSPNLPNPGKFPWSGVSGKVNVLIFQLGHIRGRLSFVGLQKGKEHNVQD